MATYNIEINTSSWTKIVNSTDNNFLVTWDVPKFVEFATTELDVAPVIRGHRLSREKHVTRENVGADFVWAKLVPDGSGSTLQLTVSKTTSTASASGGFDSNEMIQKVAMLSWNSDTLAWERTTSSLLGGGSANPVTKRIEQPNSTTLYVGVAEVGTTEAATTWGIKKITFDGAGAATAVLFANGSWTNRASHTYQ